MFRCIQRPVKAFAPAPGKLFLPLSCTSVSSLANSGYHADNACQMTSHYAGGSHAKMASNLSSGLACICPLHWPLHLACPKAQSILSLLARMSAHWEARQQGLCSRPTVRSQSAGDHKMLYWCCSPFCVLKSMETAAWTGQRAEPCCPLAASWLSRAKQSCTCTATSWKPSDKGGSQLACHLHLRLYLQPVPACNNSQPF